jgi:hypothetical protein
MVDWPERLKRVQMALAEAGFPEEAKECTVGPSDADPTQSTVYIPREVPLAIIWQTAKVTGGTHGVIPCWACFIATRERRNRQIALDCAAGNCRNPTGEKEPPRELLSQVIDKASNAWDNGGYDQTHYHPRILY